MQCTDGVGQHWYDTSPVASVGSVSSLSPLYLFLIVQLSLLAIKEGKCYWSIFHEQPQRFPVSCSHTVCDYLLILNTEMIA